jgi:hypothetical protein
MPELARRVLWLAIEDYSGLWEVIWELNAQIPNRESDRTRVLAKRLVYDLLAKGLIQIYQCQEPDGDPVAVSADAGKKALEQTEAWEPPRFDGSSWRIGATDEGERAYRVNH